MMAEILIEALKGHQEKRAQFLQDPAQLETILREGTARAREQASATMQHVRQLMHVR